MSKRNHLLLILVIVLVSLSWFKVAVAQNLNQLTPQQRAGLMQQASAARMANSESVPYRTPNIYENQRGQEDFYPNQIQTLPDLVHLDTTNAFLTTEDSVVSDNTTDGLQPFEKLRPFGAEFFDRQSSNDPPVDIAAAADYVLGPGDDVIIYLWGRVEKQYQLTVDREGKLFIPTVGEMPVWGLTLDQFREAARHQFGKAYSEFDLTCSLGKIRSIRIYVTGEVVNPGAYTVSSLTSLFNALSRAGGPNDRGSMRNIKLMRQGQCQAKVDLYQLLLKGDNSTDARLESGDVIFIPVADRQVAIRGEVKRSAIYELAADETAGDVLELAGGATAEAYLERVMLERVADLGAWEVIDVNLSQKTPVSPEVAVMDGDQLTVYSIYDARQNLVGVFGKVKHPGYYERDDSIRVSDVLHEAQLQSYGVYYERADLFRHHPDLRSEIIPLDLNRIVAGDQLADILLTDRDSIHIYSMDSVHWDQRVYIEGAVRKPGWYPLYDGMTAADLVFLAGSFRRDASLHQIELAGIDSQGKVSLAYLPSTTEQLSLVSLTENDHLFVRTLSRLSQERTVTIKGQVSFPGGYVLTGERETLYQVIQRAGGFAPNAFPKGLVLKRPSIEENLEQLRVTDLIKKSQTITIDSLEKIEHKQDFSYDLSAMNRIIIDIDRLLATAGAEGDVVMEPGDEVYVPSIPTGISVMGAVGANGTLGFVPGKKIKDYIRRAGNFTRQADKDETRLIRADGEVLSGSGVLGKRAQLGDIVVVPTRIQQRRDWGKIFTTALTTATGVLTSIYIVSKL
jgi:protein involved in polysaccharide export with SLBB domain